MGRCRTIVSGDGWSHHDGMDGCFEVTPATMSEARGTTLPRSECPLPRIDARLFQHADVRDPSRAHEIGRRTALSEQVRKVERLGLNRRCGVPLTPYSTDHGRRSDRHEGDEDVPRPSSLRDFRAEQLRDRIRVRVHGPDCVHRSGAVVCTGRDWLPTLQSYVHRHGRHAYGANARREGNQCGRRGGLRYDRNWVRGRVDGCCVSDLRKPS